MRALLKGGGGGGGAAGLLPVGRARSAQATPLAPQTTKTAVPPVPGGGARGALEGKVPQRGAVRQAVGGGCQSGCQSGYCRPAKAIAASKAGGSPVCEGRGPLGGRGRTCPLFSITGHVYIPGDHFRFGTAPVVSQSSKRPAREGKWRAVGETWRPHEGHSAPPWSPQVPASDRGRGNERPGSGQAEGTPQAASIQHSKHKRKAEKSQNPKKNQKKTKHKKKLGPCASAAEAASPQREVGLGSRSTPREHLTPPPPPCL